MRDGKIVNYFTYLWNFADFHKSNCDREMKLWKIKSRVNALYYVAFGRNGVHLMGSSFSKYSSYIYAVLRIVTGFLFLWHGSQKLLGYPPSASGGGELSSVMAIGGAIELFGGLLIMIGLLTRIAAFISSGTMAVAYFGWHFSMDAFLPIVNRGELAVLYCFVLLFIAARGSGILSVDSLIWPSAATSSEP